MVVADPEQIEFCVALIVTVGNVLTSKLNIIAGPVQVPSFAVTDIVAVCKIAVVLITLKVGIVAPEPLAAIPIEVLLLVQLKVTPLVTLVKIGIATLSFAQDAKSEITSTIGVGQFEETQLEIACLPQRLPVGAIVISTFCPGLSPLTVNDVVAAERTPGTAVPEFIE